MACEDQPPSRRVDVHLPWSTIAKIAAAALLAWLAGVLAPLALTLLLAALLATSLHPVVAWLERHRIRHGWAVLIVGGTVIALALAAIVVVVPPILGQASALATELPALREKALAGLPEGAPRDLLVRLLGGADGLDGSLPKPVLHHAMSVGQMAIAGLIEIGMVIILAIYLLLDGAGVLRWLLAFVPSRHRAKVHETAHEMAPVVFAYVAGQVITSALCAIYGFIVLTALHVPAALLLAVLAGLCDVLPVVGFIISSVPAVALAALVSPAAGAAALGLYALYHAVENYLIVPRVYGTRLRLSTLTVLIALLASYLVAGVAASIAVLPLVASFAIIERKWLTPWLHPDTVRTHERQERESPG